MAVRRFVSVVLVVAVGLSSVFLWYRLNQHEAQLDQELAELHDRLEQVDEHQELLACAQGSGKKNNWSAVRCEMRDAVPQVICHIANFNWLEPYKSPEQGQCAGSAFFISADGDMITNAHVVNQAQAVFIQVPSQGKRRFEADVVCICMERDLALIRLKPDSLGLLRSLVGEIPTLPFGDSDQVHGSDEIMTVGYPLGQHSLKCTTGIVSGREHIDGHYMIQISAPINPGNSGGPSVNMLGEVIGVNTCHITGTQNVNYIIPSNEVLLFLKQLDHAQQYGDAPRLLRKGFFGIIHDSATDELTAFLGNPPPGGYFVVEVCPGSLVDKAGLKPQDMIYSINGHALDTFGEITVPWSEDKVSFYDYISRLCFGDRVVLKGYRKGKPFEIKFVFKPANLLPVRYLYPGYEKIDYEVLGGMVFMDLSLNLVHALLPAAPQLIRYIDMKEQMKPAVVITHVMPDSVAMRARILTRPGVLLREVNGVRVHNLEEFRAACLASVETGVLTIKTTEGQFVVYQCAKILADEDRLSRIYVYPKSVALSN